MPNYGAFGAAAQGLGEGLGGVISSYQNAFNAEKKRQREEQKDELGQQMAAQKMALEGAKLAKESRPEAPKPGDILSVKKDFDNVSKDYIQSRDGWNKVQRAATDPSAVGDISLIFGYMKTIDPTSTVREGEFATAQQAGGVPARVLNVYNKALSGQRLTPEQRADFLKQSHAAYKTYESSYRVAKDQSTRLAKALGMDPSLVVTNYEQSAAPSPQDSAAADEILANPGAYPPEMVAEAKRTKGVPNGPR